MNEKIRLRELAKETLDYATCAIMNERRKHWTEHNSLQFTRPLIYIRAIPFDEFLDPKGLKCQTPYYRQLEKSFLLNRYRMTIPDDFIIEPFLTVRAVLKSSPNGVYGLPAALSERTNGSCAHFIPSIIEESDLDKLCVADYEVDEEAIALQVEKLYDAVGDILEIGVDRQGLLCGMWANDISTVLAKLRGLEQIMWDAYDRPEWLHKLLSFMQSKILLQMKQTKDAGGFQLINHQNQAMPYAQELMPPSVEKGAVSPSQLWGYMAAQEYTTFGPAMFKEFMFDYQKPILEQYGLTAYGCCEDLTQKISVIRELKNLRRIAVSPFADVKKCAEQIGPDYITSWRPNPSSAVSIRVDESFVRNELHSVFDIFKINQCKFDITLKDVETVSGDPTAITRWTQIVHDEISHHFS